MLELFQLELEFLNLVIDEVRSSYHSFFCLTSLNLVVVQLISHISLTKVSIEVIVNIALVPMMGMIFGMVIHITWLVIHTKVTRSLGIPAHVSSCTTPLWVLAIILSVFGMMAS